MATTLENGSFETDLPSDTATPRSPPNCQATILGGLNELYAARKNTVSTITKAKSDISYTISQPLDFYTSSPKNAKCVATVKDPRFGASKTIDLPLPTEWGLAPSSYYIPFVPIIGIP